MSSNAQFLTVRDFATGKTSRISLFEHLELNSNLHRTKPVPSPSAQIPAMFDPGSEVDAYISAVKSILVANSKLSVHLRLVIELCCLNGVRITEALNCKGTDIDKHGKVHIKSLKGSKNRVIQLFYSLPSVNSFIGKPVYIFQSFNRFYFYREFIKLGLTVKSSGYKKRAVTHSGRHILATEVNQLTNSIETTANLIGHVSTKSTANYIRNKKKGSNS